MARTSLQLVLRHAGALAPGAAAATDADLLRRFTGGDEAAFAELVRRHGPVVWAACRHLLPDAADAEDAFQVAFLALARSARSIRDTAAVGGWLHGVAVRAATRLRRDAARRRARERRAAAGEADRSVPEGAWDALLAAVHEEVGRLPGPLRTAFVLCDLEGVRQPDAAAQLGWKPGTLTGRLTRARQQLIARLTGRGLAPAGAVGLGVATAGAAVPVELMGKVAALCRAGGVVPSAVLELVREVTPMALNWWAKRLAAAAVVAGGLGVALFPIARAQPPGGGDPFGGAPLGGGEGGGLRGQAGPTGPTAKAAPSGQGGPGGMSSMAAFPPGRGWEYKYVEQRRDVALFKKTLSDLGAAGWEYCDHLEVGRAADATDLLVFKRPTGGFVTTGVIGAGPMMPGMMGPGGASGFGVPGPGGMVPPGAAPSGGGGSGRVGGPGGYNPMGQPPGLGKGLGGGGVGKAGPAGIGGDTAVLRAKNAQASDLARVLRELYKAEPVEITSDERTNSVIIRGTPRVIDEARALMAELDAPAAEPRGPNTKR